MRFARVSFRVAALAAVALATSSVSANQLADPSFEDPSKFTTDGAPFVGSWEAFSSGADATSALSGAMPHTGASSLELQILNSANQFAGAFQDVYFGPAGVGTPGTFSGWHKLTSGDSGGIEIRIEWRNSVSNSEISRTINFSPAPGPAYEEFSLTANAPAGSDTARIVYAIQSFGGALNQDIFVDDLSFTIIPEPASIALAAVSGLGLLAARRRR